jgi:muramoyltetrapeptide carboxypeptidase
MNKGATRIGVVAPAAPIDQAVADKVKALAGAEYSAGQVEIVFHPQCFKRAGHFAGEDGARAAALIEMAEDPSIDAIWFARGGYGSGRLLPLVLDQLTDVARAKTYLGYSDMGAILAGLMSAGFEHLAHGPMPVEIGQGGEAAVRRALRWLVERDPAGLEPGLIDGVPSAAFNLMTLSQLIGTPWQPDLCDHVLLLEEVDEHLYAIDRSLFHITSNEDIRKVAGIRLGRCSAIPENDRPFGEEPEDMIKRWCKTSGINYLGKADIGHDADNKVVPFGKR